MECVILIGAQATGKSSFYHERFFHTHVRINLDMLRTRDRERRFVETCLSTRQRFVIDNTNPEHRDRARYIGPAREAGFHVVGFHFPARPTDVLRRNALRPESERIPEPGVLGTLARLELPTSTEGFDALYRVHLDDEAGFTIKDGIG